MSGFPRRRLRERIRRRSWRDLWIYQKEVPSTFHTIQDYRVALRFFIVGYPKLKDILNDWSKKLESVPPQRCVRITVEK